MKNELVICGKRYSVVICEKPSEVDETGQELCWGQVNFWKREIRIFKASQEDMLHALLHEVLHVIGEELHLEILTEEKNHDYLDIIALLLADFFTRNKLLDET